MQTLLKQTIPIKLQDWCQFSVKIQQEKKNRNQIIDSAIEEEKN